jgi:tetratricopeptide (TPR) repeat protein
MNRGDSDKSTLLSKLRGALRRMLGGMTDFQYANRCLVAKDYKGAIKLFLRHAKEFPSDASEAYAGVATCYLRSNIIQNPVPITPEFSLVSQGDRTNTERYFRLALQANPKNLKALFGLSEILPESSAERRELLECALLQQPKSFKILLRIGDYYRSELKEFSLAYDIYRRLQESDPKDKTPYLRLNDICRKLGRPEEGEEWSQRWKEVNANRRARSS